jgi:hypothetical protein
MQQSQQPGKQMTNLDKLNRLYYQGIFVGATLMLLVLGIAALLRDDFLGALLAIGLAGALVASVSLVSLVRRRRRAAQ